MGLNLAKIAPLAKVRHTYANIGVFEPAMFKTLSPDVKHKLFPWLYAQGILSGELSAAVWHNVGTPEQLSVLDAALLA
jgi:NDP-sugar pyrophosphorylase family protein